MFTKEDVREGASLKGGGGGQIWIKQLFLENPSGGVEGYSPPPLCTPMILSHSTVSSVFKKQKKLNCLPSCGARPTSLPCRGPLIFQSFRQLNRLKMVPKGPLPTKPDFRRADIRPPDGFSVTSGWNRFSSLSSLVGRGHITQLTEQ